MQIKNVKVYGLEESILASGYPMQTGEPIDLEDIFDPDVSKLNNYLYAGIDDSKDAVRAKKLAKTPVGSGHNNFLKGIIVQFDLQYPEYFSPQLQRYHWIDIVSSQSKMHKITGRKLTKDDFTEFTSKHTIGVINNWITSYNGLSAEAYPYIAEKTSILGELKINNKQEHFNLIISNLPSGYLKWMRISTNYLQLKTITIQRKNHKLQEWREFCEWIKTLPMAAELIYGD